MRSVKRVMSILGALVAGVMVLVFVLENQQDATLSFLGWDFPQLSTSECMVLSLLAGLIISPLIGLIRTSTVISKAK